MRKIACLAIMVVCLSLGLLGIQTARAEKSWFYTDDGYYCEMTEDGTLAKGVCREIQKPNDRWYVVYIEVNPSTNRVYIDTYSPSQFPDIMFVRRTEMTQQEYLGRYGNR
jgi:hypothetical protein